MQAVLQVFEMLSMLLLIPITLYLINNIPLIIKYFKSDYKEESGIGFFEYFFDKGNIGEATTFFELEKLNQYGKPLVNLYLPTEDGTTEIDLVYITHSGIYVLESKNYSGTIYGNVKYKNWTSVINGKKYRFYNPIWQNNKHVKYLKKIVGEENVKSIIIFSKRCELKKLSVGDHVVIKRPDLIKEIRKDRFNEVYTKEEIDALYNKLKPYTNVDESVKQKHIDQFRIE